MPPRRGGTRSVAPQVTSVHNPAACEEFGLEQTDVPAENKIREKIHCDFIRRYQTDHNGVAPSLRMCVAEIVRQINEAAIGLTEEQAETLERQKWVYTYDYSYGANLVTADKVAESAGIINEFLCRGVIKKNLLSAYNAANAWRCMREGTYGCTTNTIVRRMAFEAAMSCVVTGNPTINTIDARKQLLLASFEKYCVALDTDYDENFVMEVGDPFTHKINELKKPLAHVVQVAQRPGRGGALPVPPVRVQQIRQGLQNNTPPSSAG